MDVYLRGVVKKLKAEGFDARVERLVGEPTKEIINYVSHHNTQLIAMATHGATGLSEIFFGDVTENVVRRIKKTPTLLIRPQD
jgi:nucleotide-binding universal stress UspA family protein